MVCNGYIYANYEANTSPETRVANITVTVEGLPYEIVTVTQEGFSALLMVSPTNKNVSAQAGTTSFSISSNLDWTIATNASWITIPSAGTGNSTLTVGASGLLQQISVTQEGAVSVSENVLEGVSVYPNPSNGILYITADQLAGDTQLKIIDTKGNVMMERTVANLSAYTFDASSEEKGTYLLRLDQNGKTYVTRIVLVK